MWGDMCGFSGYCVCVTVGNIFVIVCGDKIFPFQSIVCGEIGVVL